MSVGYPHPAVELRLVDGPDRNASQGVLELKCPAIMNYSLSLHDALPICNTRMRSADCTVDSRWAMVIVVRPSTSRASARRDRKSTRLNSSHTVISYAVFCLKKKSLTSELARHRYLIAAPLYHMNALALAN